MATEMLYLESGSLRLTEHGSLLGAGSLVGENGLFAPDNRRTLTLECASDCVLYSLSAEAMAKLYFQHPKLGFHVMRLIVARLMNDADMAATRGSSAAQSQVRQRVNVALADAAHRAAEACAQAGRGFTSPAASRALWRAVLTSASCTSATPIRRLTKLSGLPNSRISLFGTRSASATPSKTIPVASTPP